VTGEELSKGVWPSVSLATTAILAAGRLIWSVGSIGAGGFVAFRNLRGLTGGAPSSLTFFGLPLFRFGATGGKVGRSVAGCSKIYGNHLLHLVAHLLGCAYPRPWRPLC